MPVAEPSEEEGPDRAHEEAAAEDGKGVQQGGARVGPGEERRRDVDGEVRVQGEVVVLDDGPSAARDRHFPGRWPGRLGPSTAFGRGGSRSSGG